MYLCCKIETVGARHFALWHIATTKIICRKVNMSLSIIPRKQGSRQNTNNDLITIILCLSIIPRKQGSRRNDHNEY